MFSGVFGSVGSGIVVLNSPFCIVAFLYVILWVVLSGLSLFIGVFIVEVTVYVVLSICLCVFSFPESVKDVFGSGMSTAGSWFGCRVISACMSASSSMIDMLSGIGVLRMNRWVVFPMLLDGSFASYSAMYDAFGSCGRVWFMVLFCTGSVCCVSACMCVVVMFSGVVVWTVIVLFWYGARFGSFACLSYCTVRLEIVVFPGFGSVIFIGIVHVVDPDSGFVLVSQLFSSLCRLSLMSIVVLLLGSSLSRLVNVPMTVSSALLPTSTRVISGVKVLKDCSVCLCHVVFVFVSFVIVCCVGLVTYKVLFMFVSWVGCWRGMVSCSWKDLSRMCMLFVSWSVTAMCCGVIVMSVTDVMPGMSVRTVVVSLFWFRTVLFRRM